MATIKDVAKLAKVSHSTVSRYLNDTLKVATATQERIEKAIVDLDYVKNYNAMAMKNASSNTIAIVLPTMTDVIFSELAKQIYLKVNEKGYESMFFYTFDSLDHEKEITKFVRSIRAKACVMVVEPRGDKSVVHIENLVKNGTKVVLVNRFVNVKGAKSVNWQLEKGARLAVEYYLDNKYDKVGLVLGWPEQAKTKVIVREMKKLYKERGMIFDESLVQYSFYTEQYIDEIIDHYVSIGVKAIFVNSDMAAIRLVESIKKKNISIPNEMAVITAGNSIYCGLAGVSAVDLGIVELGMEAGKIVLAEIEELPKKRIKIQAPTLIHRDSTIKF